MVFTNRNFPRGQLDPSGKACPFKGASMAQSPGDCKLPRPLLITITTQQVPPLEKTIKARTLTSWGLVTCCGLTCSGRYVILGDGLVLLGGNGGTVLRNAIPRTPKTVFFALSCSLAPAQKVDGFPGPHFCSALSSRDAKHVPPPHWSPWGWRPPRGDLAVDINTSVRAPGLSPGKGQAFKQSD